MIIRKHQKMRNGMKIGAKYAYYINRPQDQSSPGEQFDQLDLNRSWYVRNHGAACVWKAEAIGKAFISTSS